MKREVIIIATADFHLGAPEESWKTHTGGISPEKAWQHTVQQCIDKKVDLLLVAGDLIDQEADFVEISKILEKGFTRLEKAAIDIVLITGNHDYDLLPFFIGTQSFDNVTLLGADGNWDAVTKEKHGIRFGIAGRSFPEIGQQSDPLTGAGKILESALHPLIAVLHCDTKHPESIYGYVKVERLIELSADAWVLGHLHTPELLNKKPPVLYAGNPVSIYQEKRINCGLVHLELNEKGILIKDWKGMK